MVPSQAVGLSGGRGIADLEDDTYTKHKLRPVMTPESEKPNLQAAEAAQPRLPRGEEVCPPATVVIENPRELI